MTLQPVFSIERHRLGTTFPAIETDYQVEIVPGESIRVVTDKDHWVGREIIKVHFDKIFRIGDNAEYGGYNLTYFGMITKITDKQVWIAKGGKTYRFPIHDFCNKNYDFDLDKVTAANAADMQCI